LQLLLEYCAEIILKTQQSPVISGLCLRKTWSGKLLNYPGVIVFGKLRFRNVFCPDQREKPAFSNPSSLESVFEKLRFRDGLVWTGVLTVELKLRFQISSALSVSTSEMHYKNRKYGKVTGESL